MGNNLKEIKRTVILQNLVTKPNYAIERGVSLQTVYNWIKEGRIKVIEFMGHEYVDRTTFSS